MILITGASQGIGYASACLLLERTQLEVLITGRCESRLRAARENVPESFRRRLQIRSSDQACRADIDSLCAFVADPATPIDGAILTVGANPVYTEGPRRLHSLDPATIETTVQTNCTHTLLLTTAILDRLRKQNGGVLIWVGSQAQKIGMRGAGLYCATKSFLSGLAASAHNEYAGRGVRVHLVNPGLVRTPRTAAVADRFAAVNNLSISEAADVAGRIVDLFFCRNSPDVEISL
jgi:short-subunit dehydrogenase